MNFGTSWLTRMRIAPILLLTKCFIADRLPNMTFYGLTRDTVLTNRQTEKLNFDTNYRAANYCRTSDNVRLNLANVRAKVILIGHWSDQKNILSHYTFFCCDKIQLQIHSICILQ